MFTGIVEECGTVRGVEPLADEALRLEVAGPLVTEDAQHGDSIAVNGVCLTVVDVLDGGFTADVMRETLVRTSLGGAAAGDPVNLERAARLDTRMGGHLVQGHVDATGVLLARDRHEHWDLVQIGVPDGTARYLVPKGSIAVDGVSLTVVEVGTSEGADWFTVSLIPTTLAATTLGRRAVGDVVNLEVDVIAKYVERLLTWRTA